MNDLADCIAQTSRIRPKTGKGTRAIASEGDNTQIKRAVEATAKILVNSSATAGVVIAWAAYAGAKNERDRDMHSWNPVSNNKVQDASAVSEPIAA